MKAVILAGGLGTRMGLETASRPKALVEIGGRPILWHILKLYEAHGIVDAIVCAGYAGQLLADYVEREQGEYWREPGKHGREPGKHLRVQVIDTGEATATAGRLRQVRDLLGDETFCMTYGDGVADVNISDVVASHRRQGALVTVTTVHPRLPFGLVTFDGEGDRVVAFQEKPRLDDVWVNGGFFVMEPRALDYVECDDEAWEDRPLTRLARDGQLAAYKHHGFWQCMDTPRDRQFLEHLWREGGAPWKAW
jgi:glucose-1-phosphate cytidylyltransferase